MFYTKAGLFLLGLVLFASACSKDDRCIRGNGSYATEDRVVETFTGVESKGSADVYITQDSVQSVWIEAESNLLERISTEVRNGRLEIGHKGCIRRHKKVKIYISAKLIDYVSLDGSGNIVGQNNIDAGASFKAKINGSGDMIFMVKADNIDAELDGSGNINLSSWDTAQTFTAGIDGSGNINAFDVPAYKAVARISGSGDINLHAIDDLDVNISGSGSVTYKGNPRIIQVISGSGSVNRK